MRPHALSVFSVCCLIIKLWSFGILVIVTRNLWMIGVVIRYYNSFLPSASKPSSKLLRLSRSWDSMHERKSSQSGTSLRSVASIHFWLLHILTQAESEGCSQHAALNCRITQWSCMFKAVAGRGCCPVSALWDGGYRLQREGNKASADCKPSQLAMSGQALQLACFLHQQQSVWFEPF